MYTLPHPIFVMLEAAFNGDRQKAEQLGNALEKTVIEIKAESKERIEMTTAKQKAEVYDQLRQELATQEFVRAEINRIEGKINKTDFMLKVLISLSVLGLTVANPGFLTLIEKIFE